MLAEKTAPDPARAGWLSGSRALVVMHGGDTAAVGGEKVSPKGAAVSPTAKSVREFRTDWVDGSTNSVALNGAKCLVDGCPHASCTSREERSIGFPRLCAGHLDLYAYGIGWAP